MSAVDLEHERLVNEYRGRLAAIDDPAKLTAECLGAIFTGLVPGTSEDVTGTLVSIRHTYGLSLFGGASIYTFVKICPGCVHRPGGDDCVHPEHLDELQAITLTSVIRNGDGTP